MESNQTDCGRLRPRRNLDEPTCSFALFRVNIAPGQTIGRRTRRGCGLIFHRYGDLGGESQKPPDYERLQSSIPQVMRDSRKRVTNTPYQIWSGLRLAISEVTSILDECHLCRESDDSGAHCWLLDTDKGSYKTLALFRRCVNIYRRINEISIAHVRLFLFRRRSDMCCKIRSAECSGSGSLAISSRAFELPLHQKRVFLRSGVVIFGGSRFWPA
jgi:hypothetical protein